MSLQTVIPRIPAIMGSLISHGATGTSVWCMMGVYEGIMGVKRDYEGLMVDPCFPAEWEEAEVQGISGERTII